MVELTIAFVALIAIALFCLALISKRIRGKIPDDPLEGLPELPPIEAPDVKFPSPRIDLSTSGTIVPKDQAPELSRNERRRYAKLHAWYMKERFK